MSRVDDREAERTAARLQEAKRQEDAQKTKKFNENSAFKKLVGSQQQQAQANQAQRQQATQQESGLAKSAIAELLGHADAEKMGESNRQEASTFKSRLGESQTGERVQTGARQESEVAGHVQEQSSQSTAQSNEASKSDKSGSARSSEAHKSDRAAATERAEERSEASSTSSNAGAAGARGEKGDIKADADKGGGGQQGSKDGKDGAPMANPSFRFNPALMAPVSVAKTKEASGSERLRKVANELAQKIVERVRIGTNAAGKMEFQVDLKSDVLSGLSLKISAHNGKIKAVFQGSDKDVLKMIEEQGEALKQALGARGLTLEDLKIEAR